MSIWNRKYRLRPTHERAGNGDTAIARALKKMWRPEQEQRKMDGNAKCTISITNRNRTVKMLQYKRLPSHLCISLEDGRHVTMSFEKDGTVEIEANFNEGSEWITMPP